MTTMTPAEAAKRGQIGGAVLLDVRTPAEFESAHAPHARNIPLDRLDPNSLPQIFQRDGIPVAVICQSGTRGQIACEKLAGAGWNAINVEGGMSAWEAAGLPLVRGRKMISLERQVRIVAGFLVFIGVALGWFVHPAFFGLSAFIGAGLMVAGFTDFCGMGLLLAKMPWNQRGASRPQP